MMSLAEFERTYLHCKSWADCKTYDEQRAFIFGWGSLNEVVNWIAENPKCKPAELSELVRLTMRAGVLKD
jgi:hypothetical protein